MSTNTPRTCDQLGVCQAHGTCTGCLVAAKRHPYPAAFAPGVIEGSAPSGRRTVLSVLLFILVLALALLLASGTVDLVELFQ